MISAIVLVPDHRRRTDVGYVREVVVRSLVWLVSAVVSGVVRDVVLAGPAGIGLGDIARQAGCKVVEALTEAERLGRAASDSRDARLLILKVGFQPEANLVEEIDAFVRRAGPEAAALILATPETMLGRISPARASVIGILIPRDRMRAGEFRALVRATKGATRLRARATLIA